MVAKRIEEIGVTLGRLATPGISPKDLLAAARRAHPGASKKDIVRAAFYALIANADSDAEKARRLQDFAIVQRPMSDMDD